MTLVRSFAPLSLCVLVGCSPAASAPDASVTDASADDAFVAAADAATDAFDPAAPRSVRFSRLRARSYAFEATGESSFEADLADQARDPRLITTETVGECVVTTIVTGTTGPLRHASAGSITLSGATQTAELTFALGGYPPFRSGMPLWVGGEMLTFSATGAEIPAFEANVIAPSPLEITAPELPAVADSLAIDRAADLDVSWTGTSAGVLRISIASSGAEPFVGVRCEHPVPSGSAVVTSAVLSRFTAGAGLILIDAYSAVDVSLPDWGRVEVSAESGGRVGARTYASEVDFL